MKKQIGQVCLFVVFCYSGLFAQRSDSSANHETTITKNAEALFTFFQLQAVANKKILLQWSITDASPGEYFTIERNANDKNFETIGVIRTSDKLTRYEFTDDLPFQGYSLYRIRYTNKEGAHKYSDSISYSLPGTTIFSFYPNPVDNVLIIRADFAAEMQITDGFGKLKITRFIGQKPSIIDVSTLEKGVYLLRVINKTSGQQQAEKFIKK